jgi:signal transduction histidine kinase
VRGAAEGPNLHLSIGDDGVGGADVGKGSVLIGLIDRIEALGGSLEISKPVGIGTSLPAEIPLVAE